MRIAKQIQISTASVNRDCTRAGNGSSQGAAGIFPTTGSWGPERAAGGQQPARQHLFKRYSSKIVWRINTRRDLRNHVFHSSKFAKWETEAPRWSVICPRSHKLIKAWDKGLLRARISNQLCLKAQLDYQAWFHFLFQFQVVILNESTLPVLEKTHWMIILTSLGETTVLNLAELDRLTDYSSRWQRLLTWAERGR